jgi:hypothetical protein
MRFIAAMLALWSITTIGCTKASDRHSGVGEQPEHPYQNSPGTVPTQPSAAGDAAVEGASAPQEAVDRPGTTRTPASVDQDLEVDAGAK